MQIYLKVHASPRTVVIFRFYTYKITYEKFDYIQFKCVHQTGNITNFQFCSIGKLNLTKKKTSIRYVLKKKKRTYFNIDLVFLSTLTCISFLFKSNIKENHEQLCTIIIPTYLRLLSIK